VISAFFFIWFFTASLWTVNALRRPVPPGRGVAPLWLPGMVVSELAPVFLVLRGVVTWAFLANGAGRGPLGIAGVGLFILSELGLLVLIRRSIRAARDTGHSPPIHTLWRIWESRPREIDVDRDVDYWNGLSLHVYRRPGTTSAPALIYIHPGSWMRGGPGRQARALIHRLSTRGWVVLDIRYPLSPSATFPDHLIGVRKAIAWAKTSGKAHGVDPDRVVVSGGSSGAHLAALAALTAGGMDDGVEGNLSVIGCLPFYGIYDLLVRNPTRYDWPFVARHVMKATPSTAPDLYRLGSPIDQVAPGAPPFLVIHGEFDSVVLPAESRHFVEALASVGASARYHEVHGAQHGFDAIASFRTRAVTGMCVEWLESVAAGDGRL
jgi:acetyl esterase/lipase